MRVTATLQAQKSKADQSKDTELEKENKQIEDLKKQLDETQVKV